MAERILAGHSVRIYIYAVRIFQLLRRPAPWAAVPYETDPFAAFVLSQVVTGRIAFANPFRSMITVAGRANTRFIFIKRNRASRLSRDDGGHG